MVKTAQAKQTNINNAVEKNYLEFEKQALEKLTPKQAQILKRIGECESGFQMKPNSSGSSTAFGIFQTIKAHDKRAKALGYQWRGESAKANIALAIELFKEQGTTPWTASKHCWNK